MFGRSARLNGCNKCWQQLKQNTAAFLDDNQTRFLFCATITHIQTEINIHNIQLPGFQNWNLCTDSMSPVEQSGLCKLSSSSLSLLWVWWWHTLHSVHRVQPCEGLRLLLFIFLQLLFVHSQLAFTLSLSGSSSRSLLSAFASTVAAVTDSDSRSWSRPFSELCSGRAAWQNGCEIRRVISTSTGLKSLNLTDLSRKPHL